jgi:FeS assembly SUF system protein
MTPQEELDAIKAKVVEALKTVKDPEIPVNIYDLGLVYEIQVAAFGVVNICMTLTAPACPVADSIVAEVQSKVSGIPEVSGCYVDLVWDPPWDKMRMTLAARLELNML